MDEPHFAQVALSVADMAASVRFYGDGLGFPLASGRYISGPGLGAIQGLRDPSAICFWLVSDQPFFQLELFQYASPPPAPRTASWRPSDIGYSRLGISVPDIDAAVAKLAGDGHRVVAAPQVVAGVHRGGVLDPTGIPIDLVEARDSAGPRVGSVSASVPSLKRARSYFIDTLGLGAAERTEADPGRERLWGLDHVQGDRLVAKAGDVEVELVEYRNPTPAARRDGFRLNDHGVLNIALGYRDWAAFHETYERVVAAGHRTETAPMGAGGAFDVSYCTDSDGFSVELLYCPASSDEALGFVAAAPLRR